MKKAIAINGSPRKGGNTSFLIKEIFKELEKNNINTELIELGGHEIRGCTACYKCKENKNKKCIISKDIINECIEKMSQADIIILGSPVYFANVSSEMKAIIDRAGLVGRANDFLFKRKLGVAICCGRRAGCVTTVDAMNHFFLANQMIVVGSDYWNLAMGRGVGDVLSDTEGLGTMKVLGENLSWLANKI